MTQATLWQEQQQSPDFAELCNALYERELQLLAAKEFSSALGVQNRLKSLSYYINRTALLMTQTDTPMNLDVQNATWSFKQTARIPLTGQEIEQVNQWYLAKSLPLGLIVPVLKCQHKGELTNEYIILDSIDRIDEANNKFRTNVSGWFNLTPTDTEMKTLAQRDTPKDNKAVEHRLLKPTKKVMIAACTGHCWQENNKKRPIIPSLRELLLSCSINWKNFKQPLNRL